MKLKFLLLFYSSLSFASINQLLPPCTNGQYLQFQNGWSSCGSGGVSGITTLNLLTDAVQTFAVGTTGADFNISSISPTHTFNIPSSSASNRGLLTSTDWSTFNNKQAAATVSTISSNVTLACNSINFVDTTSARSETLPSPTSGCIVRFKDKSFNASTNPITFLPAGGEQLEGTASNYVFRSNGGAGMWVADGTNWYLF